MASNNFPKVGSRAPSVTLHDQDGVLHNLDEHKGRWILLYFYPKDNTPGCTKEACAIRDSFQEFSKINAVVFGISADSEDKHKKFANKYDLPFTLLSDPDKVIIKEYGAWGKKKFLGKSYEGILRVSFLINPEGKIAKIYEQVKPKDHAIEVLKDIRANS